MAVGVLVSVKAFSGEAELKWDNGIAAGFVYSTNVGEGYWWANDFDAAAYAPVHIVKVRVGVNSGTPPQWDGFRVAIFSFTSVPGNIIWPTSGTPLFVMPSGSGSWIWWDVTVNWDMPAAQTTFAVGMEQYFLPPNNDCYVFDNDPFGFQGHTWQKVGTAPWTLTNPPGLKNLMVRAVVDDTHIGVLSTSLGRVKSLYR